LRSSKLLQTRKKFSGLLSDYQRTAKRDRKSNELYKNDSLVSKIAHTAAEIEGTYYGKLTRVEEIIAFAKG